MPASSSKLEFHPLTPGRWRDFETLFGERGACGGCWCMWQRLARSQFNQQKGEKNKKAMRAIVEAGEIPGILAYADGKPADASSRAILSSQGKISPMRLCGRGSLRLSSKRDSGKSRDGLRPGRS
jgi:hypothetical protein